MTIQPHREASLGRCEALLNDREALLDEGEALIGDREALLDDGEGLVGQGEALLEGREALLGQGEALLDDGEALVREGEALLGHGEGLLDEGEGLLPCPKTVGGRPEDLAARPETSFSAGEKSVLPQYRETGTTTWLNGPICTQMRNIPVPILIPGKTYDFRIQFIGGSTGQSDWSDVVSHMVT